MSRWGDACAPQVRMATMLATAAGSRWSASEGSAGPIEWEATQ